MTLESLFQEDLESVKPAPECKLYDERFDWYEVYCRDRYSPPADWTIYKWEAKGERGKPGCFVLVEGAVFYHKLKSGKRKGRIDYKKPEPDSKVVYPIMMADLDKFKAEWSERTGKCHECYGTGQQWAGWHHINGTRYRDCFQCKATGASSVSRPANNSEAK